jgi:hypothetical protein
VYVYIKSATAPGSVTSAAISMANIAIAAPSVGAGGVTYKMQTSYRKEGKRKVGGGDGCNEAAAVALSMQYGTVAVEDVW